MNDLTGEVLRVGHRGAKGLAPENTLSAVRHALGWHTHMIEIDVYRCKSGELVVHHDFRVDRTTNGKGLIEDLTLQQIRALDAGDGERVPLLSEVIELIDRQACLYIEIKSTDIEQQLVELINDYVDKGWSYDDFVVVAYDHFAVKKAKELEPKLKTGTLLYGVPLDLAACVTNAKADYLVFDIDVPSQALVDDAHKRGAKVLICTVNHPEDIKRVRAMGVDGIISDYPDRLFAELS